MPSALRIPFTTASSGAVEAGLLPYLPITLMYQEHSLAFAWTQADNVPLLLGQVNFFMEFNVCFYRSQQVFEVQPKQ